MREFGVIDVAVRCAPTLGEIWQRFVRYTPLVTDLIRHELRVGESTAALEQHAQGGVVGRQLNDLSVASDVGIIAASVGSTDVIRELWFMHPVPDALEPYANSGNNLARAIREFYLSYPGYVGPYVGNDADN